MIENETIEILEQTLEQLEEIVEKRELKIDLTIDQKKTQEPLRCFLKIQNFYKASPGRSWQKSLIFD